MEILQKYKLETIIQCKNADLGYENKSIVDNVNITVNTGDYVCIIGENGAGKSTLIKTILGLIKPVSGEIIVDESIRSGNIGYLPQQTPAQKDFPATVFEVVLSGFLNSCKKRPFYNKAEKKNALENMEKMQIADLRKKCYRELSGGQQQRVLLTRALCAAKKILILDEPVTGLDPDASYRLYDTLDYLNKNENMAIIMVSHDIKNVLLRVDKIIQINEGQVFYGTVKEYYQTEQGKKYARGEVK